MRTTANKMIRNRLALNEAAELSQYADDPFVVDYKGLTFTCQTSSLPVDNAYVYPATAKGAGKQWVGDYTKGVFAFRYPTVQDAVNAAQALRCPVNLRPTEVLNLPAEGITVDITQIRFEGFASSLNFPFSSGTAVHVTGPGGNAFAPYRQNWCGFRGVEVTTPTNSANTCVGFDFSSIGEPGQYIATITVLRFPRQPIHQP